MAVAVAVTICFSPPPLPLPPPPPPSHLHLHLLLLHLLVGCGCFHFVVWSSPRLVLHLRHHRPILSQQKSPSFPRRFAQSASIAAMENSTVFTSILASSKVGGVSIPPQLDYVVETISTLSVWTLLLTVLAMCVVYDQCALWPPPSLPPREHRRLTRTCAQSATSGARAQSRVPP